MIDDQSKFGLPVGPAQGYAQRRRVLEQAQALRLAGSRPGTPWARSELLIPELDFAVLIRRFPDLASPDHEIKRRAWLRFSASSLAEPYRVNDRNRARRPIERVPDGGGRADHADIRGPGLLGELQLSGTVDPTD